ncbi:hypothetical protein ANN_24256 [Periplaneta americana]|uniref:Uncharacterized protein n=1 Tax=Periplaneta americana TaxID=6978 RepID=A0ABQ8S2X2_PERAM|nr:hypothetical protein ANN_24256 [Periplaneta americana]
MQPMEWDPLTNSVEYQDTDNGINDGGLNVSPTRCERESGVRKAMGSFRIFLHPKKITYEKYAMMSLSLVKNSGRKLSPQSDVRVGDTGEGHVMTKSNGEKKRRSSRRSTATWYVKTPLLPAGHDTTGKLAKPMMINAATKTPSRDHFEEASRQYAKWEEKIWVEGYLCLQQVESRLYAFQYYSWKEFMEATDGFKNHAMPGPIPPFMQDNMPEPMPEPSLEHLPAEAEVEERRTNCGCWSCLRRVYCGLRHRFRRMDDSQSTCFALDTEDSSLFGEWQTIEKENEPLQPLMLSTSRVASTNGVSTKKRKRNSNTNGSQERDILNTAKDILDNKRKPKKPKLI